MVDIETWIENYKALIQERFGDRVWFVGLQGSYARGEATDDTKQLPSEEGRFPLTKF